MKKIVLPLLLALVSSLFFQCETDQPETESQFDVRQGTALVITGAAARIPQEAALLEKLHTTGKLSNVVFISGVSSGSINAVIMNGILTKKYTWSRYKNLLFSLSNNKVFVATTTNQLPVSTAPLKQLLKDVINDTLGYKVIQDLPMATSISIVSADPLSYKRTFRLSNSPINTEYDASFDLDELIYASTAYPIIFPTVNFTTVKTIPNSSYIDGATAEDYVPYTAVLEYEKMRGIGIDTLLIVSRKGSGEASLQTEFSQLGLKDVKDFQRLNISMDDLTNNSFLRGLRTLQDRAPNLAARTFIFVPELSEEFLVFDFGNSKRQYEATSDWAKNNNPIPLAKYLETYGKKK